MTELRQIDSDGVEARPPFRDYKSIENIGKTVSPLFKKIENEWGFQTGALQKRCDVPGTTSNEPDIVDNVNFHYFMLNIFKAGCLSHISVRPDLAIPLSLMLALKYFRNILQATQRKKALLISLTHPIDISERLMSCCMGRSVRFMQHDEISQKDWTSLMWSASSVHDLGIDFWQESAFFETGYLKILMELSSWPYGLVVINDSIGELEPNYYVPVDQYKKIRLLATELNLPVIVINSHLQQYAFDAEVFDHLAQLHDESDSYQLLIKSADNKAYGRLSFVMSPTCNILEDVLANVTTSKPENYNLGGE